MLDLNLSISSQNYANSDTSILEHSFTSNSSSLDNGDSSLSFNSHTPTIAYNFDILNNNSNNNNNNGDHSCVDRGSVSPGYVTHELFPGSDGPGEPIGPAHKPMVDVVEVRSMMKSQQVKKSRRGPRSRSSQYRGVTFYRRTGRWESHIWFVLFCF